MTSSSTTGRRLLAAALFAGLAAAASACSSSGSGAMPLASSHGPSPSVAVASDDQSKAVDSRAESMRSASVAATKALRSYTFASTATIGTDRTSVTGRAVLPSSLDYILMKGSTKQEVLRVAGKTYVRSLPGKWSVLTHEGKSVPPLQGLQRALVAARGLQFVDGRGELTGTMSAADAASAGLIRSEGINGPIAVSFRLDSSNRVKSFALHTSVQVGAKQIPLDEQTVYDRFNEAPSIGAP